MIRTTRNRSQAEGSKESVELQVTAPHPHHARRKTLRHVLAVAALVGVAIAFAPIRQDPTAPARVTVEPAMMTITVPPTSSTVKVTDVASCDTAQAAANVDDVAAGPTAAALTQSVHVQVLPGKAQWKADSEAAVVSNGDTRILAGKVLYAVGDNHTWKLVAHITGANGHLVIPTCTSAYLAIPGDTSTVISGDAVTVTDAPVVVCQGTPGHSGGLFSAALDLDGRVSGDISVTVELVI